MLDETEVLRTFATLRRETLHVWIERGWLSPARTARDFRFRDIDVARLRMIDQFSRDLDLGDDAHDVVLPLIDQLHGLRRQLRLAPILTVGRGTGESLPQIMYISVLYGIRGM